MLSKYKGKKPPPDYHVIAPIIEALENELRDKVKESNIGKRKTESMWPVLQINRQRTRYVYDMFYMHRRISRRLYDWCLGQKIADAALIAKWKRPGYERLCSTYVINPTNYKFNTTSICRVPLKDRSRTDHGAQSTAQDPTTGCLGCASGKGQGPKNIFGNKYGQNLAAVQIAREKRMELIKARRLEQEKRKAEEAKLQQQQQHQPPLPPSIQAPDCDPSPSSPSPPPPPRTNNNNNNNTNAGGDSETDDDSSDEEDYGPSPAAGVWASSQTLLKVAEGVEEVEDEDTVEVAQRPNKKMRAEE